MIVMVMMVVMLAGMCPGLSLYAYAEGGVVDGGNQGMLDDEEAAALVTISDVEVVLDEGSTVSYEPANGVLKLNNAHLSNDYQDEALSECLFHMQK